MTRVFIIAGEPSGDVLGRDLIDALRAREPDLEINGIGGPEMEKAGLRSLMPMEDLAVMGLFEVVKQLPRLLGLIDSVIREIEAWRPDIVLTIDLPDFNFRVAKGLKKKGICTAKRIHYVAPTVWAWRPGRAKKIAQFLDGLICLFPFEPPYFERHGLSACFAGHPLAGVDFNISTHASVEYDLDPKTVPIGLFFGSRRQELEKIGPVLTQAVRSLKDRGIPVFVLAPTLPHLKADVEELLHAYGLEGRVITELSAKKAAYRQMKAAAAVSGTIGLELALAGVPHVIAYRMNPLSWLLLKMLVSARNVHLANIILNEEIIPELLQNDCTPERVARELATMIENKEDNKIKSKQLASRLRSSLCPAGQEDAASAAANYVLGF